MIKIILAALLLSGITVNAWCGNYIDNGDSTVTDIATGLMWQQEDDNVPRNWENAIIFCEELNNANYQNWRLPNIKELQSIVDLTTTNPTIDPIAFPSTNTYLYWSSTTYVDNIGRAWQVGFDDGRVTNYDKSGLFYVRCVR